MMYSSGSRTEPWTKSASRLCIMRGRERKNSAFSSVSSSLVHRTAAAATGLNQSRSVERSVTARSWLPVIVGHLELAYHVAALVGARPVADDVAEAIHGLHALGYVPQDRLERLVVAVDVGDHRVHKGAA